MCKFPQNWHLVTNRVCGRGLNHAHPLFHTVLSCLLHHRLHIASTTLPPRQGCRFLLAVPATIPRWPTPLPPSPAAVQLFVQLCGEPYWGTGSAAWLRGCTEPYDSGVVGVGRAHVEPWRLGVEQLEPGWAALLEEVSWGTAGDGVKALLLDPIVLTSHLSIHGRYVQSFLLGCVFWHAPQNRQIPVH